MLALVTQPFVYFLTHRPIAERLEVENKANATRGREVPFTGSEILTYLYNSDNVETKTVNPPGRNRLARCGSPSPTGRSLIRWGSYIEPARPGEDRFPSPNPDPFVHV